MLEVIFYLILLLGGEVMFFVVIFWVVGVDFDDSFF